MVSIWGTLWLLQHAMFARPLCNLSSLGIRSGPIQGAKAIACLSTTNDLIGKRMRPYCKLETEQKHCTIIVRLTILQENFFGYFRKTNWQCIKRIAHGIVH